MKKWMALLLAAVMCLALAACGSPEAAETEPQMEEIVSPAEPEPTPEEAAELPEEPVAEEEVPEETGDNVVCCVLNVSINPEFNLELNKNGAVLALECLNEDAQSALATVDVVGLPADEAVTQALEAIYQHDPSVFPEDQPNIKVTVTMYEDSGSIQQAIARMDEAVMSFAESHQIPIAYMRGSAPASEEISTVISDSIDENGNRVVVEVDGDGVEWKTISSSETGQVIELIRTDPDGTVTHSDMQTNITTETKPDGTTSQTQGVIGKG